jgi:hypothetical protein
MRTLRRADVWANDGDTVAALDISLWSTGLTTDEQKRQMTSLKRAIAEALTKVKFSDFGIENIRIRNKKKNA